MISGWRGHLAAAVMRGARLQDGDGYEYLLGLGVRAEQISNVLASLRAAGYAPHEWSDQLLEVNPNDVGTVVQQAELFMEINEILSDDEDSGDEGSD
eukprot:SAG31_NODE_22663_length_520_cov_1.104513_1_plen_96_part_10